MLSQEEAQNASKEELIKKLSLSSPLHFLCSEHEGMKVELYCEKCNVVVCGTCTVTSHKSHPVREASEEVKKRRHKIVENVRDFRMKKERIKKEIKNGEEIGNKMKSDVDKVIKQVCSNLQQLIQEREKTLLAESNEIAKAKNAQISLRLEGFQRLLESMCQCHTLASAATTEYSDVQFLSIAKTLQDRTICLQQQFTDTALDLSETPDISFNFAGDELSSLLSSFGRVSETVEVDNSVVVVIPRNTSRYWSKNEGDSYFKVHEWEYIEQWKGINNKGCT